MARPARRVALYVALIALFGLGAAETLSRFAERSSASLVGPFEAGGADGRIGFGPGGRMEHGEVVTVFNDGAYVGPMRPRERTEGVRRVVVLGDSFSFGWAVGDERAWPAVLERSLGPGVEVLNFAVPGQNTWLELEHYRQTARQWRPDVVLLGWYINDAAVDRRSPNVFRLCPLPAPRMARAHAAAMERSALVRVLSDLDNIRRHGSPLPPWDSDLVRAGRFGFDCSMLWVAELAAEVEAEGARFAVVGLPHLDSLDLPDDPERQAQERLAGGVGARGVEFVGVYDVLAGRSPSEMQTDDLHPSAAAYALIGAAVAPRLARLLGEP